MTTTFLLYREGSPFREMEDLLGVLQGKPVAVALMRVFGTQLAELPLVATRATARRQGHARVLVAACQNMLASIGVKTLSLPAASSTVSCPPPPPPTPSQHHQPGLVVRQHRLHAHPQVTLAPAWHSVAPVSYQLSSSEVRSQQNGQGHHFGHDFTDTAGNVRRTECSLDISRSPTRQ